MSTKVTCTDQSLLEQAFGNSDCSGEPIQDASNNFEWGKCTQAISGKSYIFVRDSDPDPPKPDDNGKSAVSTSAKQALFIMGLL